MKYRLLTKEQFEALHNEFATFLAVQEIDKTEWEMIKVHQIDKVDLLLEQFSDLVWEDVLNKTQYLEHISKDSINLFYCTDIYIYRIVIRIEKPEIDLTTNSGYNWFIDHSDDKSIQYFSGKKTYINSRNEEIFKLIEQGSQLTDHKLFDAVNSIIK